MCVRWYIDTRQITHWNFEAVIQYMRSHVCDLRACALESPKPFSDYCGTWVSLPYLGSVSRILPVDSLNARVEDICHLSMESMFGRVTHPIGNQFPARASYRRKRKGPDPVALDKAIWDNPALLNGVLPVHQTTEHENVWVCLDVVENIISFNSVVSFLVGKPGCIFSGEIKSLTRAIDYGTSPFDQNIYDFL
jgi:hypothetical protein